MSAQAELPPAREVARQVITAYAAESGKDWRWENLRYAIEKALRKHGVDIFDLNNSLENTLGQFHEDVEREMEAATVQVTVTWLTSHGPSCCSCTCRH